MNIPEHWAKETQPVVRPAGRSFLAQLWGGSESSCAEVGQRARERLSALVRKLASGQPLDRCACVNEDLALA